MAIKRKFPKEVMQEILWDDLDDFKIIRDEITDTGRWSIHHELIFKHEDKFYMTHYSVGATECQDERPFEYEGDEIECTEVVPVEKVIIDYVPVKS